MQRKIVKICRMHVAFSDADFAYRASGSATRFRSARDARRQSSLQSPGGGTARRPLTRRRSCPTSQGRTARTHREGSAHARGTCMFDLGRAQRGWRFGQPMNSE